MPKPPFMKNVYSLSFVDYRAVFAFRTSAATEWENYWERDCSLRSGSKNESNVLYVYLYFVMSLWYVSPVCCETFSLYIEE